MAVVNNMDVAGLVRRIRRYKYEINKCVSASLMHTTAADVGRFFSYIGAIRKYFDWMVAQPQQDLPESHPTDYDLGEPEKLATPENEALADLITQFDALETEMTFCQSARMHTSVMPHDEKRFRDILTKIENFITDYIQTVQPLDMPESTPLQAMTGPGRRTVGK
jgi:hypothetical protein